MSLFRRAAVIALAGLGLLCVVAPVAGATPAEPSPVAAHTRCPATVSVPISGPPEALVVTPDQRYAYVTGAGSVSVVDLRTKSLTATVPVGSDPLGIDVNRSGSAVYVANAGSGTISKIDTRTRQVRGELAVGGFVNGVAVRTTRAGDELYVTDFGDDAALLVDAGSGQVRQRWAITEPAGAVLTADGSVVVPSAADGDVLVIDAATKTSTTLHRPDGSSTNPGSFSAQGTVVPLPGDSTTWLNTATGTFSGDLAPIAPGVTSHATPTVGGLLTLLTTRDYVDSEPRSPGNLTVVTTRGARTVATIPLGVGPDAVATGRGMILVAQGPANDGGSSLELIPAGAVLSGGRCAMTPADR